MGSTGIKEIFSVRSIDSFQCKDWLLYKHYAKRIPSISYSFGLFDKNNILQGVLTIGKPASPFLCNALCGEKYSRYVYELNRVCVMDNLPKNTLSFFVSSCLKILKKHDLILVSYADTAYNHHGYIYQATNWIYTGIPDRKTDVVLKGINNSHARHKGKLENSVDEEYESVLRSDKHRYVYFLGKKKKEFENNLNYKPKPYPKGENKRYDSGYKPTVQMPLF